MTAPGPRAAQPDPHDLKAEVGVTVDPVDGRAWVVLQLTDGTMAAQFRLAPSAAAGFGVGMAQGLAQMAAKAFEVGPKTLITPPTAGGLIVPQLRPQNGNGNGRPV